MKRYHWILLLLLSMMWSVSFNWYLDIEAMEATVRSKFVRYDLIFLPINMCVTLIALWVILKVREH